MSLGGSSLCVRVLSPWLTCRIQQCCAISSSSHLASDKEPPQKGGVNRRPPLRRRPNRRRVAHTWFEVDRINANSPWSSVWQGPKSFDPYMVPFPLVMGKALKGEAPPTALGNLELMKIPNFLHLTPPAIEKHCKALKPLCTPWPEKVPFMPLRVQIRNYIFSGDSVKHPGSKHVMIRFKLSDLGLSERARKKMIQLVGPRYKEETDTIRLFSGRCPTRAQNLDYVTYLLKVLYLESNKVEPWEEDDSDAG